MFLQLLVYKDTNETKNLDVNFKGTRKIKAIGASKIEYSYILKAGENIFTESE